MIFWYGSPPYTHAPHELNPLVTRLKSFNTRAGHQVYTVGQINTYPLGIQATQVVTSEWLNT